MTYEEEVRISQMYGKHQGRRDVHLLWAMWLEEIGEDPSTLEVVEVNRQGEHVIKWKGHLLGAWNRSTMCLHIGKNLTWGWGSQRMLMYHGGRARGNIIDKRPTTLQQLVDWLQNEIWRL